MTILTSITHNNNTSRYDSIYNEVSEHSLKNLFCILKVSLGSTLIIILGLIY